MRLAFDVLLIAALIWGFARYNARTGILFSFFTILATILLTSVTYAIFAKLGLRLGHFVLIPNILILAACLTFINGTQPNQTAKIVGWFLVVKIIFGVIWSLLTR